MAYQPKSYRKFLATSVTAALVATVAAPAIPSVSAASNFADQNQIPKWAVDAVDYLVDKGAIEGKLGNKFDPNGNLTRAEAAKILAVALGLDVDEDAKTEFPDAKDHWGSAYIAAIQDQLPGVIEGYNGNFRPNNNITRQELAKMVAEAYELELEEGTKPAISFSDNHGWGKEYVDILANLGIVQGYNDKFKPNDPVTRAETAVFVHRTEVPEVRVTPESSVLTIKNVTALDDTNRFLQITFSQKVNSLEPSDITIEDAKSKERYGVKEVNLSSNGLTAQVELFSHESREKILQDLTDYTVTVNANGKTLQYTFNRPAFLEQRVVDIDVSDRQITIQNGVGGTRTLKVPKEVEDFDFQSVLGEKVSVWHNKENELVDFAINEESTVYDAIEFSETNEVKLLSDGSKHKFSKENFPNTDNKKITIYYNGEEAVTGDFKDGELVEEGKLNGKKFNFAKVGYDKSGNVEFISVYNLKDFLIVDKVDGNEVVGYAGEGTGGAFNAKDATIIKDNKVIALSDLKQGDVLFFNKDANNDDGFAEVLNQSVSGEIKTVFSNAVRIDGKDYKFTDRDDLKDFEVTYEQYTSAVYINDDNETEYIDSDAAEELQAAGNVTVYTDRAGNVVYIAGDTENVERNTVTSILTSDINLYEQGNRHRVEVEAKFSTGEEKLFDVNLKDLKSIIVDGVTYDIDNGASNNKWTATLDEDTKEITLTHNAKDNKKDPVIINLDPAEDGDGIKKGDLVKLHLDKDRNRLEKIEFYESRTEVLKESDSVLEAGDSYVKGKKLNSKTIVFDAKNFTNNAKDITITTWGEYKGSDISKAKVIYDKNNEVIGLVIDATTTDADVYEEAVITNVLKNTDGEVTEITAFIGGELKTLDVDDVSVSSDFVRGVVAVLAFDENNDKLVKDIIETSEFNTGKYADKLGKNYAFKATEKIEEDHVDVGKREVIINGISYRLASDGLVIDAKDKSDIKKKSLTDLRGKTNVAVILDEKDSNFVKYFVIEAAGLDDLDGAPVKKPTKVTGVANITDVSVPFGTTAEQLDSELPSKVKVTFDNGQEADVNVTWNKENYKGNETGEYVLSGKLDLETGVILADGVKVEVKVIVGEEDVPEISQDVVDAVEGVSFSEDTTKSADDNVSDLQDLVDALELGDVTAEASVKDGKYVVTLSLDGAEDKIVEIADVTTVVE